MIMKDLNIKRIKIAAGIDIGGTNTVIGFIDLDDNILSEISFETKAEKGAENFVIRIVSILKDECTKLNDNYILSGIGIAAPSATYLNGTMESAANLNWGNINIINMLKAHFNIPIALINDADAAALGEHKFGIAKDMKNFIVLTLGTGLGSGIFIEGHLLHGENGHAGELGHLAVESKGRQCSCGRYDCLETYVSAKGLIRSVFHFLSFSNAPSALREISFNELTGKKISELAHKQDPIALGAFNYTGEILGKAMANIVNIFNPEAIILYGGLAESEELLISPTNKFFENSLLNVYKGKVRIIKSQLQNGKAAVLGSYYFVKDLIMDEKILTEGEEHA